MAVVERACPRCGSASAAGHKFCGACGLDLAAQPQPVSREEWLAHHGEPHHSRNGGSNGGVQPAPAIFSSPQARSGAEKLLGAGGLTISASMGLYAIGSVLALVWALSFHVLAGVSVALGFDLLFALALISGLAIVGSAFFARPDAMPRLLQLGSGLTAGALFARFVASAVVTGIGVAHQASGTDIAAGVMFSLGFAAAGSAAAVAATGLDGLNAFKRDGRLGAASIMLGVAVLLLAIADIVGSTTAGVVQGASSDAGIEAAGLLILMGAAVIRAVAFLMSSQRLRRGDLSWSGRNVLLGVAMILAGISFLLIAIGGMLSAGHTASLGFIDGKLVAALWLQAVQYMGWVAAFSCASIRFFLSLRGARTEAVSTTTMSS